MGKVIPRSSCKALTCGNTPGTPRVIGTTRSVFKKGPGVGLDLGPLVLGALDLGALVLAPHPQAPDIRGKVQQERTLTPMWGWGMVLGVEKMPDHLVPTMTDRGFLHLPPIEGFHAGRPDGKVRVYESSAASGPHIWVNVEGDYVTPGSVQRGVDVSIHLPLEDALKLAEQIKWLVKNHYQVQPRRGN